MSAVDTPKGAIKDFAILLISAFFIFTYNNIYMVATPLLITGMGGTEIIAGLQATLFIVAAVILRFFFGPLADVYGRRLVMLIGSGAFLVAAILQVYANDVWQLILLRLIQAVGLASYFPAASATAAACASKGRNGRYLGIYRMVASLSLILGPALALHVIQQYGNQRFIQSMIIFALVGMGTLCLISGKVMGPRDGISTKKAVHLSRNLNFLPILRWCPLIIATTFIIGLSYGFYTSFATPFITANTRINNAGFFFTVFAIGGIIANLVLGFLSDRFGRLCITVYALLSLGTGTLMFAHLPQVNGFFYPAGFLSGFGYYGSTAVLMAWLTEKVSLNQHTSAFALLQNALDFGIAAGSGLFGVLLTGVSANILYGIFGGLYIVYGIICIMVKRPTILKANLKEIEQN